MRYKSFEFVVVPFGLTNAPTTFICMTNNVLNQYLENFVLGLVDEILVYLKTKEEHEENLNAMLQLLKEQKVYVKLNNCDFLQS